MLCKSLPTLRKNILPPISGSKIKRSKQTVRKATMLALSLTYSSTLQIFCPSKMTVNFDATCMHSLGRLCSIVHSAPTWLFFRPKAFPAHLVSKCFTTKCVWGSQRNVMTAVAELRNSEHESHTCLSFVATNIILLNTP